ncbi:hypothetical protein HYC85_010575 [Camellia sinensis]|uniref:Uncharacterized protein n=1 Tax=Camellia sinensis TaxID=4442 RepID=A0A7J7HK65_CAMSI|nr:hypothetical protein HYC85_010575 [Camellia sinensis]
MRAHQCEKCANKMTKQKNPSIATLFVSSERTHNVTFKTTTFEKRLPYTYGN